MKQHITKTQWEELSEKQKDIIYTWKGYLVMTVPKDQEDAYGRMLSIGEMIEFLGESLEDINRVLGPDGRLWSVDVKGFPYFADYELCDALWEAVKFKLND